LADTAASESAAYKKSLQTPNCVERSEANIKSQFEPEALMDSVPEPAFRSGRNGFLLQEPEFIPHGQNITAAEDCPSDELCFVARGGVSRWNSETGVKICGFSFSNAKGRTNQLVSLQPANIVMYLVAEMQNIFSLRYGFVISDLLGRNISIIYSPIDRFKIGFREKRRIVASFNPLQLGPGQYTLGVSVLEGTPLESVNHARRFDLLGRSFEFSVTLPDSLAPLSCTVLHSAEWRFSE
jgi:lipopolysaccharide transport system ATP-binding protein